MKDMERKELKGLGTSIIGILFAFPLLPTVGVCARRPIRI